MPQSNQQINGKQDHVNTQNARCNCIRSFDSVLVLSLFNNRVHTQLLCKHLLVTFDAQIVLTHSVIDILCENKADVKINLDEFPRVHPARAYKKNRVFFPFLSCNSRVLIFLASKQYLPWFVFSRTSIRAILWCITGLKPRRKLLCLWLTIRGWTLYGVQRASTNACLPYTACHEHHAAQ